MKYDLWQGEREKAITLDCGLRYKKDDLDLLIWKPKGSNPYVNLRFRSEQSLNDYLSKQIDNFKSHVRYMKERREERKKESKDRIKSGEFHGAEVSKEIRRVLKLEFPDIPFSVRYKSYSMGHSIDIYWTNGPTEQTVKDKVGHMHDATFDGMQDLKEYFPSKYHVDYLFFNRELTQDVKERYARTVIDKFGLDNVSTYQDLMNAPDANGYYNTFYYFFSQELNKCNLDSEGVEIWN